MGFVRPYIPIRDGKFVEKVEIKGPRGMLMSRFHEAPFIVSKISISLFFSFFPFLPRDGMGLVLLGG